MNEQFLKVNEQKIMMIKELRNVFNYALVFKDFFKF